MLVLEGFVGLIDKALPGFNILGISELKWTGMGEFNSDDHYYYYCGQESHSRRAKSSAQSIPQPVMLKKLNSSMKSYKTF